MKKESWFILGFSLPIILEFIVYGLWFHKEEGLVALLVMGAALAIIMTIETEY